MSGITMRDIGRQLGVSAVTVSKALAGKSGVSEEMRQKIIRRAFVDPRPNSEWFWSLTESGVPTDKPIVEEWKCPYHNSRMCLRVMEHLA